MNITPHEYRAALDAYTRHGAALSKPEQMALGVLCDAYEAGESISPEVYYTADSAYRRLCGLGLGA
jgi:hypothetical protein